jgi:simple sugar transport system permease protein
MNLEMAMTALLATALLSAVPLALASVGEALGERAGLLNLGTEGMMLLGAFAGFWVSLRSEALGLGLLAGAITGLLCGVLFGLIAVVTGADQVLLGLGFTLAGGGLTSFLFREAFGSDQPLLAGPMGRPMGGVGSDIPVVGPALLGQPWFFYIAWIIVAAVAVVLKSTTFGLRIRAVGDAPDAVDSLGISVRSTRVASAICAGTLAGLAGASLSIMELGFFQPYVTHGTGFIAIALAMLGRWNPVRIALMAVLFGALRGMGSGLQLIDVPVQPDLVQLLPYVGVVVALVLTSRGISLPPALGITWTRRR